MAVGPLKPGGSIVEPLGDFMSYMDHNAAFAPAGGIQELSFDEVGEVDGGIVPIVAAVLIVGGVILVGFAIGLAAGYLANS